MNSNNQGMNVPMDDIFNTFFGGGIPGFPGFPGFPGMPPGAKIHIFHGGPMGSFQQAFEKPVPIVKNIEITIEQVLTGANIPIDIERWIVENGNKVFENETIYIDIPQGIDDGEIIILRDKGNVINDQIKGDIKIFVKVTNNTLFKRQGLDLILERNISLKEALCGFSFEIKYINGKSYTLNNNKGSIVPPEYRKIYPDLGLKRGEHTGNMIIIFHIDFPESLKEEQINKLIDIL
jgi:DnaJ-class molecular chaperone